MLPIECIAGQTYTLRIAVRDESNTDLAKVNPTINAQDFLISINDGNDAYLTNTPTVINSGSVIRIILSAAETTAAGANGSIVIKVSDASGGGGWIGGLVEIPVRSAPVSTLTTSSAIGSVTGAVGSVTGNVGGNVVGSVANVVAGVSLADGAITAAKIATDALTAAKVASDAVTKIQNGLATATALATVAGYVDTEVAAILAAVDTEVVAIKAVTDNLPNSGALTTITNNVAAILDDTGTSGVVVASASKSGYSLATDQSGVTVGTINSLGTSAQSQVNAQADQALADYDAPTKAELDSAIATIATPAQVAAALATYDAPTYAEMIAAFTEIKGATWATTDTLEAIRDRGDAAWLTATGFATPTNVSDAQAAIIADTGATEAAALAAIAALNNLSAAQVWAYAARTLTGTAAAQTNPVVGSTLNITRAATYSATLTGLSVPDGWTSARFTIKVASRKTEPDQVSAIIQILVTATPSASDGLVILNCNTSGLTKADASLAISGTSATITIADDVTAKLAVAQNLVYDIKFYHGSSLSTQATEATCNVVSAVTQVIS